MVRCARPPRHGVEYRPRNRPCDTRTVQARALLKRIRRAAVQVLSPPANQQSRGHPAAIVFYMAARPEDQRARATEASRCPTPLWPSRRRAPAVPPRISSAADSRQRPSAAVAHRTSAHEPPVFFRRGNQARQRRRLAPDLSLLRGDHGGRRDVSLPGRQTLDEARPWWMEEPPGQTVVAVQDGTIVGSAKMGPNRPGRGAHVATASFLVDPAHQGHGTGRALGQYVLDWTRAAGFNASSSTRWSSRTAAPCTSGSRSDSRSSAQCRRLSIIRITASSACTSCSGTCETPRRPGYPAPCGT